MLVASINLCYTLAGNTVAPCCYLNMLHKLQKRLCRTIVPSLTASLKLLAHCRNLHCVKCLYWEFFWSKCRKISTRKTPNTDFFHAVFFILVAGLLVILIDCMIFLSSFLHVIRMSTVYFLAPLDSVIIWLQLFSFDL